MSGPDFVEGETSPVHRVPGRTRTPRWRTYRSRLRSGANADVTNTAYVFAFQVAGAEPQELIDAFKAGAPENADPLEWTAETVGGKPVEVAEPTDEFPTPVALYAVGDVLYFVNATDQAAFEAILEQLPE